MNGKENNMGTRYTKYIYTNIKYKIIRRNKVN